MDEPPLVAEEPAVANGMGVTEIAGEDSVEEAVEEMMTAEAHSEDDEDSFPVLKNGEAAPPPPIAAPVVAMAEPRTVPAANGAALPVIVDERLAGLEERVNELSDAKERLERQVAAQSEELRVQRAAIARTQRVLRTVVRPEDEATEPVPKVS